LTEPNYIYESYLTGDDAALFVWNVLGVLVIHVAQTFTPAITHTIKAAAVKIYRMGLPGTLKLDITAVDGGGHPTGAALATATYDGDSLGAGSSNAARVEIDLGAGCALTAGTTYAIDFSLITESPDISNRLFFRLDSTSPTYAGGNAMDKSSVNWTDYAYDLIFEDLGTDASKTPRTLKGNIFLTANRIVRVNTACHRRVKVITTEG
jgi:hypothetical protein